MQPVHVEDAVMAALGVSKRKVHTPGGVMLIMAKLMEKVMSNPLITSDQLQMLQEDNICRSNAAVDIFGRDLTLYVRKIREFVRPAG